MGVVDVDFHGFLASLAGVLVDVLDDEGFDVSFVPEVEAGGLNDDGFVRSVSFRVSFVNDGMSSNIVSSGWLGGYWRTAGKDFLNVVPLQRSLSNEGRFL